MKPIKADNKRKGALLLALLLLVLSVGAELLISNFHLLYSSLFQRDCRYFTADMTPSEEKENISAQQVFLVDSDHVLLTFSEFASPIRSVSFYAQYRDRSTLTETPWVELSGYDENQSDAYVLYAQAPVAAGTKEAVKNTLRLSTHGTPSSLDLLFSPESDELLISRIAFNEPEDFSFSPLRWGLLLLLAALLWVGKIFHPSQRLIVFSSRSAKITLTLMLVLAVGLSLIIGFFFCGEKNLRLISYPLVAPVEHYSPYVQQFDAFQKGQLSLDVPVSEELAALADPYDWAQRESVDALWDRAYFEGRYYSYFGIAPILVLFYPFYLLGGVLPSEGLAMMIFAAGASCFAVLCLWELAKLLKKKLSYTHFILGSLACLFSSMIWLMQRGVDRFYYLACVSAMCFFFLFFYLLLKGFYAVKAPWQRRLLLLGAGLSYSLLFLSRVNAALIVSAVVAVMLICGVKKHRKHLLSYALDLFCLAAFVLLTLAFSLWFNAARFKDPLEFGTKYQLTVSNISYNRLGIENLIPSLYHYFFAPLKLSTEFPFFFFSQDAPAQYGHYVYLSQTNAGLFSFPLFWALFSFGLFFRKRSLSREYRLLALTALIALPLTAFFNFSLGGSILRYLSDLAPSAAILSTLLLWELCDSASAPAKSHGETASLSLTKGVFILSVGMGVCLLFLNGAPDFAPMISEVYLAARNLFLC